jgi:hypothetical protein
LFPELEEFAAAEAAKAAMQFALPASAARDRLSTLERRHSATNP